MNTCLGWEHSRKDETTQNNEVGGEYRVEGAPHSFKGRERE